MKFRKITSLFLATTMAVSSIFSSTSVLAAEKASITEGLEEGSVGVKRNAEWINNDTIKVEVSVDGVPKKEGIDAILIVDISGSMDFAPLAQDSNGANMSYTPWDGSGTKGLGMRNYAARKASENFIETLYKGDADNRLAYGFFGTDSYDSSLIELSADIKGDKSKGKFDTEKKTVGDGTPLKGDSGFISKNITDFSNIKSNMITHARNQLGTEGTQYSTGIGLAKYYIDNRENKNRPISVVFMSDGENGSADADALKNAMNELKTTDEYGKNKLDLNTVGLDLSSAATLEGMTLGDGQSYKASSKDVDSLSSAFETIVNRSQKAGTNAKITEKIASGFELVDNPKAPEATNGTIAKENNELTWNLGNITTKTETMTYYLKVKDTTETGKDYLVTENAVIDYVDVDGNNQNRNTDEEGNRISYEDIIGEVIYKDVNGDEIGRDTVKGKPGSTVDIPVLDKPGYLPKVDSSKTITLDRNGNNVIEVIYVVDPNQKFKYTVKHIKPDGSELAPTETKEAPVETLIEASKLAKTDVVGYTFESGDPESIVIKADNNNEITVKYMIDKNYTGFKGEVHYKVKGTDSYVPTLSKDKQIQNVNGTIGEKKTVTYPVTPGYIAVDGSKQTEITLPEDPNKTEVKTIEFVLDKTQKFGYEVQYVMLDKNGKEIPVPGLENAITTGYDNTTGILKGEGYYSEVKTLQIPNILGYKVKDGQQNQLTITEKSENNRIKVTYEVDPNQKFEYEIKYHLEGTTNLVPGMDGKDIFKGTDMSYNSSTGVLKGSAPIDTEIMIPKPTSGELNSGYGPTDSNVEKIKIESDTTKNKKTIYYKLDDSFKFSYTINHYIAGDNPKLIVTETGSGNLNEEIPIIAQSVDTNYKLQSGQPSKLVIKSNIKDNTINVYYEKDRNIKYDYKIEYVDDKGNTILPNNEGKVLNGGLILIPQPTIEGYKVRPGQPTFQTGRDTDINPGANDIKVIYDRMKYEYKIKLVDKNGLSLKNVKESELNLPIGYKYDETNSTISTLNYHGETVKLTLASNLGTGRYEIASSGSETVEELINVDPTKNIKSIVYEEKESTINVFYYREGTNIEIKPGTTISVASDFYPNNYTTSLAVMGSGKVTSGIIDTSTRLGIYRFVGEDLTKLNTNDRILIRYYR